MGKQKQTRMEKTTLKIVLQVLQEVPEFQKQKTLNKIFKRRNVFDFILIYGLLEVTILEAKSWHSNRFLLQVSREAGTCFI